MAKTFIREQRHLCGSAYMEVDVFPVTARQHNASPRGKKQMASSVVQKNLNDKNARRHFTQLVHTNFTPDDWAGHYTYAPGHLPASLEEAERHMANYMRRVNYALVKRGLPLAKYVYVTEQRGKRGKRYHHHVIISCALTSKELKALWSVGRGGNKTRLGLVRLDNLDFDGAGGTIEALCEYMLKDPAGKRRWTQSSNLKQPERPRPNDGRYSRRKLNEMAATRLDDADFWRNKYPGWEPVGSARAVPNEFNGWHVYARLRRAQPPPGKGGRTNGPKP